MTRNWRWLLKAAVSVGLLLLIFRSVPLSAIWSSLRQAHPWDVAAGLLIAVPMTVIAASRLQLLLSSIGVSVSLGQVLRINLTSSFYSLVLPGFLSTGVLRWYRLNRAGSPGAHTFAVLLLSRLIESTIVVLSGLTFWLLEGMPGDERVMVPLFAALLLGLGAVYLIGFNRTTAERVRVSLTGGRAAWVSASVREPLLAVVDAIRDLGHPLARRRVTVVGLSLVGHLLGILLFLFFARGLDITLPLTAAGYTRSMLLVAGMLPLSIGGFGVREGGMILLLHPYGVAPQRAVALAFLLLGRDLIGISAGGWLELRAWLARRPQ
ncbi:MAG TPA: lysylphosphatidylglycerol synthase transmembrane domain-containing protein [Gemmatimonadales bacterium]